MSQGQYPDNPLIWSNKNLTSCLAWTVGGAATSRILSVRRRIEPVLSISFSDFSFWLLIALVTPCFKSKPPFRAVCFFLHRQRICGFCFNSLYLIVLLCFSWMWLCQQNFIAATFQLLSSVNSFQGRLKVGIPDSAVAIT